jgi:hypothetical protein
MFFEYFLSEFFCRYRTLKILLRDARQACMLQLVILSRSRYPPARTDNIPRPWLRFGLPCPALEDSFKSR